MNWKKTAGKSAKVAAIAVGVVVGVAVLVAVLFQLRTVRESILSLALDVAQKSLPGKLSVGKTAWPSPGALEFDGVAWTNDPDTLVVAERVRVAASLPALVRRDVHLEELVIAGARVDIPSLVDAFGGGDGTNAGDDGDSGNSRFPRDGALRGVPSVAVDRIDITAPRLRGSETVDLRGIVVRGKLDVLHGSVPKCLFDEVQLTEAVSGSSVANMTMTIDLDRFTVTGKATIESSQHPTFYLECNSTPDRTFKVVLTRDRDLVPPQTEGLAIDGRVEMDGHNLRAIEFVLDLQTPGTEDLQRVPALKHVLAKPLEPIAPLEGIRALVRGRVLMRPEFSALATVDLCRNSWLDTTHVSAAYDNKTLTVDSLEVALPGLDLSARCLVPPSGGSASVSLRISEATPLTRIVPGLAMPGSLSVNVTIDADGLSNVSDTAARLRGSAKMGAYSLDTLDVTANIPRRGEGPYVADCMAALGGGALGDSSAVSLRTVAKISTKPVIDVSLSEPAGSKTVNGPNTGRGDFHVLTGGVRYDPDAGSIALDDLRLDGSLGSYSISASLDSLQRGAFEVECEWAEPPPLLFAALSADSAAQDTTRWRWAEDGPFTIQSAGRLAAISPQPALTASAALHLPGPRDIAPLFADGAAVDDLGPIGGRLVVDLGSCNDDDQRFDVRLDVEETSWLDTAVVDLRGCGRSIALDSVCIAFEGFSLAANGGAVDGVWDLRARLALTDSQLVARFRPDDDAPSIAFQADAALTGASDDWRVLAQLDGRLATPKLRIPQFTGSLAFTADSVDARLALPRGLSSRHLTLDSVYVSNHGRLRGGIAAAAEVKAFGPDVDLLHKVRWSKDDGVAVHGDTLYLRVINGTLASLRPYELTVEEGKLVISDMALDGTLGRVRADGYFSSDSANFDAQLVVHAPEKPRFIEIADRLWPDSLQVHAQIDGPSAIRASAEVSGILLNADVPVSARVVFTADKVETGAQLKIESKGRALLKAEAKLPAYRLGDPLRDGPMILDLQLDDFPVPADYGALTADDPEELGRLSGRVAVRGLASDPSAIGSLRCNFTGGQELSKYRLLFESRFAGNAPLDTALVRIGRQWFQTTIAEADETPGLRAQLSLTKSSRPMLTGELVYPLSFSLSPPSFLVGEPAQMSLRLQSENVPLTDFDPMLPPDLDLEGTLTLSLDAIGDARDPALNGSLRTDRFRIVSVRGAQIEPDVSLDVGGSWTKPSFAGEVQVRSGFIRMPKRKSSLYPVKGRSALWEAASVSEIDSTLEGPPAPLDWETTKSKKKIREMDVDVRVYIPGSFRIVGDRLNAELSGDLRIVQKGQRILLIGQLTPLSGQLLFMGRSFEIRRGDVTFYGGDELNPSFDLLLQADVSDVRVDIKLTGTAEEPIVELTSDPQMSESDIMSLLLFGARMSDLDNSQSGLLQQRTAEMLLVFGAAKLQSQMSEQLGVDIVTVQQSTRKPDESALVVGKYLNSRTLLKYEQNLQNSASYLINLEYSLIMGFKLETFIDQASETGAEINWSKDY